MWQYILCRATMVFAQAVTGTPAAGDAAATSAPAATPAVPGNIQVPATPAASGYKHTIWHGLFLFVYFLVCVGLVTSVLLQTTKSEGLSGIIGGSAQSVFKGKKGFEETLQEMTNYLAVAFVLLSLVMSVFMFK